MLLKRMSIRGPDQMPPLASNISDPAGTNLVRAFILGEATTRQSFAQWQVAKFNQPLPPEAAAEADPDTDNASNMLEYYAGTNPKQSGDAWGVHVTIDNNQVILSYDNPANRGVIIESTSVFPPVWTPVEHPDNHPIFPATADARAISDPVSPDQMRWYRARLIAP
jgi:hypothetical protein